MLLATIVFRGKETLPLINRCFVLVWLREVNHHCFECYMRSFFAPVKQPRKIFLLRTS